MLSAYSDVEVGTGCFSEFYSHFHKFAYADLIQLSEGIVFKYLCIIVSVEELAGVVT